MKKAFPNSQQLPGTQTCGPNCLSNIYLFFGKNFEIKQIMKELGVSVKTPTYTPQIAIHTLRNNLKATIIDSSSNSVSPSWKGKASKEVMTLLKKRVTYELKSKKKLFPKDLQAVNKLKKVGWAKHESFLYYFLKEGGKLDIADLSTRVIDSYLNKGYLLVPCLEQSWLWGERKIKGQVKFDSIKGEVNGHFVVIYSKDQDNYLISDPYPTKINGRNGLYKVPKDKLLVATLLWGGQILAVKK